jgi:hypothetical protein
MELNIIHARHKDLVFNASVYARYYTVRVFLTFTDVEATIIDQRYLSNLFVMKCQQDAPDLDDPDDAKGPFTRTITLQTLYQERTYRFDNALEAQAFEANLRVALARVEQQIYAAERDHTTPVSPKEKMPKEKVLAITAAVILGIVTLPWTIEPIIVIVVNVLFGTPIGPLLFLAALLWPFGRWCYRAYHESDSVQERLAREKTEVLQRAAQTATRPRIEPTFSAFGTEQDDPDDPPRLRKRLGS